MERSADSLSVGIHLITATITDASGATASSTFSEQILRYRPLGLRLQGFDSAGKMRLLLEGDSGTPYQLESSPDLQNWSTLETGAMPAVIRQVLDPASAGQPRYFWRVRQ